MIGHPYTLHTVGWFLQYLLKKPHWKLWPINRQPVTFPDSLARKWFGWFLLLPASQFRFSPSPSASLPLLPPSDAMAMAAMAMMGRRLTEEGEMPGSPAAIWEVVVMGGAVLCAREEEEEEGGGVSLSPHLGGLHCWLPSSLSLSSEAGGCHSPGPSIWTRLHSHRTRKLINIISLWCSRFESRWGHWEIPLLILTLKPR